MDVLRHRQTVDEKQRKVMMVSRRFMILKTKPAESSQRTDTATSGAPTNIDSSPLLFSPRKRAKRVHHEYNTIHPLQ